MTAAPVQFDDGKAPDALRTIGELARALGLRQHVLRYWEDQFPQLQPLKLSGGRRHYRPADVALVARIDQLVHREGYTLKGARLALEGGEGDAASTPVAATGKGLLVRALKVISRDLTAAMEAA